MLGAAAAARLPVGLALPLLLYLYRRGGWLWVLVGVAIPALVVAAYNVARFGDVLEFGYGLIRNVDGESVLDEPWYPHGIDSIFYIPEGLYTMLLRGPEWIDELPWVIPGWAGTSVLLTMPILWWLVESHGRLAVITADRPRSWCCSLTSPTGIRASRRSAIEFIVDALPLLWVMLAIAFRDGLTRAAGVALVAGIIVNVWLCGVVWLGYQD